MEEKRARAEEAMFYALEQKSLRHVKETPLSIKVFSLLYEMAFDYGRSFVLSLLWLLVVFVFFSAEYSLLANRHLPADLGNSALFALDQMVRPFKALTFGYDKLAPPLVTALLDGSPVVVRILAAVQTLTSLGLVTLFVLAVRRRFKMG